MSHESALLTEEEMERWGEQVGREATAPLVLALYGDLGAGKSTLARAIARGLGIEGPIPSPTFNLLFRYSSPRGIRLAHLDLYRLESPDEVWELGWADLPEADELVLIEWPERAALQLPRPRWKIEIEEVEDPDRRRVGLARVGDPPPLPPLSGGSS